MFLKGYTRYMRGSSECNVHFRRLWIDGVFSFGKTSSLITFAPRASMYLDSSLRPCGRSWAWNAPADSLALAPRSAVSVVARRNQKPRGSLVVRFRALGTPTELRFTTYRRSCANLRRTADVRIDYRDYTPTFRIRGPYARGFFPSPHTTQISGRVPWWLTAVTSILNSSVGGNRRTWITRVRFERRVPVRPGTDV